jgi:hypothetical protein
MVMLVSTHTEAWETLEASFASQSTARVMQISSALGKVKKLDSTTTGYFNKVKSIADVLSSIGQPLLPEEFNSYLLAGSDSEYDALVDQISLIISMILCQFVMSSHSFRIPNSELSHLVHTWSRTLTWPTTRPSPAVAGSLSFSRLLVAHQQLGRSSPHQHLRVEAIARMHPVDLLVAQVAHVQRVRFAPKLVM